MFQEYEKKLQQNMLTQAQLEKVKLCPKKSLEQIESETHRDLNYVRYWTCNCGSEYGDWEATQIVKCHACGRDKCPACDKQHGFHKLNRDRFGLCFKEVK